MEYGIKLNGELMKKFDTPDEAYQSAIEAYVETGEFHEVVNLNPVYTYMSEQGRNRTINTIKEAKSVIVATAMSREINRDELMNDKVLTELADIFGINLNELKIERSIDPRDFYYTYSFDEKGSLDE